MRHSTGTELLDSLPLRCAGLLWGSWIALILFAGIVDLGALSATAGLYLVAFHTVIAIAILLYSSSGSAFLILFFGFAFRILVMLLDMHVDGFTIPNSGGDSEGFFQTGVRVSRDSSLLGDEVYGGLYSKILGITMSFVGPLREVLQYSNVLAGMTIILVVYAIGRRVRLSEAACNAAAGAAAFWPNSIITSSILLREVFIALCLAISLYFIVCWMLGLGLAHFAASFAFVGFASAFHSGVVAVLIAYIFAVLFYQPDKTRFLFSVRTVPSFVIAALLLFVSLALAPGVFMNQIEGFDSSADVLDSANSRSGGAAYLTGMSLESPAQAVIYSPIRAIYFLASPLPWDWRGLFDIVAFMLDSIIYLGIGMLGWRYRRSLAEHWPKIAIVIAAIVACSLIFGLGVSNSGTAMRHRTKLLPYFAVLFGFAFEALRRRKSSK